MHLEHNCAQYLWRCALGTRASQSTLTKTPSDDDDSTRSRASFSDRVKKKVKSVVESVQFGPTGHSKTAIAEREARRRDRQGEVVIDKKREAAWKAKIIAVDPRATFVDGSVSMVRHSGCGKEIKMKYPYDASRMPTHHRECGRKGATALVPQITTFFQRVPKPKDASRSSNSQPPDPRTTPCTGLSDKHDGRILEYLQRSGAMGGGARSVSKIAEERFKKLFKYLSKKRKAEVLDAQQHEWRWRNDHAHSRVFSTSCAKSIAIVASTEEQTVQRLTCANCLLLLDAKAFRDVLRKPIPSDEAYRYTNHIFRNTLLGEHTAKTVGVRQIFIDALKKTRSACVIYAEKVLSDGVTAKNDVFAGLLDALVAQQDREDRGVGMQNFRYAPALDEFLHIISIHSPRAYKFISQYLPARSLRSFREKRSSQPTFPMDINEHTFELVAEHLSAADYNGPVALACDDTKLFPAYRLYWDSNRKSHYLIGAVGGPLLVADPDQVATILEDPDVRKASKVRLWCLQIPLPKIPPIIVAALPIPNDLDAQVLLGYLERVLNGLISHKIRVISYACDGTEVERSVQRLLVAKCPYRCSYTVHNPNPSFGDLDIPIAFYQEQAIVMIQDSKHALKTFRNNLFSGARLLVLGNFTALYARIREIAFEDAKGSPLYHRDVDKLDRQDDNAALRLFSAQTLEYVSNEHPDYIGEIVYLFIFGELVDAYQSRVITHAERLHLALRAHYFLQLWTAFLRSAGYKTAQYYLSREAADIARILIDGLISLIIVHRDHLSGDAYPLLPWLHSSEPCEHVFGEARQVVKDFTMLDFYYMLSKLRVKLREAVLHAQTTDSRATANGYAHTYFDASGTDFVALAHYPSNQEVSEIALRASEEAQSLVALLGLRPGYLVRLAGNGNTPPSEVHLPSIRTWFTETQDDEEKSLLSVSGSVESPEPETDAAELHQLIEVDESADWDRSQKEDVHVLNLTFASLSLLADDHLRVQCMHNPTEEEDEEALAGVVASINATAVPPSLPALQISEASKPFGLDITDARELDFSMLVKMRREHQTRQAAQSTRTRRLGESTDGESLRPTSQPPGLRRQLIARFHDVLNAQQDRGVGTGSERALRWRAPAPGGHGSETNGDAATALAVTGNSANAIAVATSSAKAVRARRRRAFHDAGVPHLDAIVDAAVNYGRPIVVGSFFVVFTESAGVMIAKVVALYFKSGGKNGKHAAVTDSSDIAAISNVAVQVFQQSYRQRFCAVTEATGAFLTNHYQLLPSIAILSRLATVPTSTAADIDISQGDLALFTQLHASQERIRQAIALFKKRGRGVAEE